MKNAEDLIYDLYNHYQVNNNIELASKLNITQQTISNWKSRNSINPIKKKCRELGIYDDIFGDINNQEQHIGIITGGQVAHSVTGGQHNSADTKDSICNEFNTDIQNRLSTISTIINDDNVDSFNDCLKNWILDNL